MPGQRSRAVTDDMAVVVLRLDRLETDIKDLKAQAEKRDERIDRLVLAFLGSVLTIVVFALGIAVTLLSAGS